jgi:hypothetical protein
MNTEYIFRLFNENIDGKSDKDIEDEIINSADHNIRMFMKYITNLKNFQIKLLMIAGQKAGIDIEKEKARSEWVGYHKSFSFIAKVNIYKQKHLMDLDLVNPYDLCYCLQICKNYFYDLQDYDKVAFLFDMIEFLEEKYENLEITE